MPDGKLINAEEMAKAMREVSIAEFFEKNRHLLGYETPTKALVTIMKEAVDNSLDAADEAGILPTVKISVKELEARTIYDVMDANGYDIGEVVLEGRKPVLKIKDRYAKYEETKKSKNKNEYFFSVGQKIYTVTETKVNGDKQIELFSGTEKLKISKTPLGRFRIAVEDNGPGVISKNVSLAFGKLLYGSKFHRLRQSRGTQGIGISGAILYSQLTTGKAAKIVSMTEKDIADMEMRIDVSKNQAQIVSQKIEKNKEGKTGLKIEIEAEGRYVEGKQGISEFLKQTAISNPHAKITYDGPNGKISFERATEKLPERSQEIKPHPYGVELGILSRMLASTKARNLKSFLLKDFSRVRPRHANEILKLSRLENIKPSKLQHEEIEKLHRAMQMVKLPSPPTNVLSLMGEDLIVKGLKKEIEAEHFVAVSRPPAVYRGMPFAIEVGLAYGGKLSSDQTSHVMRFANKVPLIYHQSDCATSQAVEEVDWRRYGFSQSTGSLPQGPLLVFIHFASVWVPYTSEGKQAIANYPEIVKEIKLALQDAGRKLYLYVNEKMRSQHTKMRRELFEKYIPELAESLEKLTDKQKQKIIEELEKIIKKGGLVGKPEDRSEEKS
jgi:DNA topoisomerase-6 subunit B